MSTKRFERDEQREIGLDYGKRRDAESVFVRFVRCWKVSEVLGVFYLSLWDSGSVLIRFVRLWECSS